MCYANCLASFFLVACDCNATPSPRLVIYSCVIYRFSALLKQSHAKVTGHIFVSYKNVSLRSLAVPMLGKITLPIDPIRVSWCS